MYQLNDKIRDLKPYDPIQGSYRVRLDANESFLPLPREILGEAQALLPQIAYNRYPDPAAGELCAAFAACYGVNPEYVVAGNGSDELITVLFEAFLQKGDAFVPVYNQLLRSCGSDTVANVAASVGIDVRSVDFWRSSLEVIKEDIDTFCKLCQRM